VASDALQFLVGEPPLILSGVKFEDALKIALTTTPPKLKRHEAQGKHR
jgi:hypothetical protein